MEGGERIVEYLDAHTWRHELHAATQTVLGAIAQLRQEIAMSDQAELDAVKSISDDFDRLDAAMTAIQNAFESAKLDGQSVPVNLANAITAAKTKGDTDASAAEQKAVTDAPQPAPLPEPPAEAGGAAPVTDSSQPQG